MDGPRSQKGELLPIDDNIDRIRQNTKKGREEEALDREVHSSHSQTSTSELEEREEEV